MARYLLESSATDGYLLEDGTGVLLLDEITGDNAYESAVLTDSPTFFLPMDESSGNLTDIVGSKTATANGAPTYGVTGPVTGKTAIDFGASTDYFTVADHADLDLGNGPFTIEYWFARDEDTGTFSTVLHKGTGAYAMAIDGGGTGGFPDKWIPGAVDTSIQIVSNNTVATDSAWHHVVWTRTGGADVLYIDGVSAGTDQAQGTAMVDTSAALEIGRETASFRCGGKIAYIAFYKSALSGTRVAAHFDAAAGGSSVSPATLALALAAVAPSRIDQEVSPAALALALDTPAPSIPQLLDAGAIALSLGIVAPSRIDLDLSPAAAAIALAAQAFTRVDQDAAPAALALALATVAPDLLATIDPAALAVALTAQAPGRIDQDASPAAIPVTLGPAALSVEARVDPVTLDLALTPVAPTRLDLAMDMPAIALMLSPEAPTRINLDLTLTAQGLVLTPVAPTRLDQDATLIAIAITLDTPALVIDVAGSLTVSPGLITLLLAPEAPRVDQEASLAPIALAVGLATPALDLGLGVGALSLTLTPEAPVSLDQQVLVDVLLLALATLSPSVEFAATIARGTVGVTFVVRDSLGTTVTLVGGLGASAAAIAAAGALASDPAGPGAAHHLRDTVGAEDV